MFFIKTARREDPPVHLYVPPCFSAMVCTSAHYRRLDGGFSLNASQKTEANSVTPRVAAESTPCDNGTDSSGQKSMPAAKGERQSRAGILTSDA